MGTHIGKLGLLSVAATVHLVVLLVFLILLWLGFHSVAFALAFPLLLLSLVLTTRVLSVLWVAVAGLATALCVALVTALVAPDESLLGLIFGLTSIALGLGLSAVSRRDGDSAGKPSRGPSVRSEDEKYFGEVTHDILHIVDREGGTLFRSASSYTTLGHESKRMLQLAEYVHPDDLDKAKAELRRVFASGRSDHFSLRFVSDARLSIPVEVNAVRLNERLSMVCALDRTDVLQLERRLMEAEARYRILIEQAIDTLDSGIILIDQRQEVLWANATVGRFFGIDRD